MITSFLKPRHNEILIEVQSATKQIKKRELARAEAKLLA